MGIYITLSSRNVLKLVVSIQAMAIALLVMGYLNISAPLVRQLILLVYLTFIPGALLFETLRLEVPGFVERLGCYVGLSVAIMMFVGLFANTVYPLMGVCEPISLMPLAITFIALTFTLSIAVYLKDNEAGESNIRTLKLSLPALFLLMLPFLAIIGAYLINYHSDHTFLIIVFPLAGLVPLLIAIDIIDEELYPLAIFSISLFLLYHTSLFSPHVGVWDINLEYYFANRVIANGWWDPELYGAVSMPAIVMLVLIYTIFCNIDVAWVFEIIYSFIFSSVPLLHVSNFVQRPVEQITEIIDKLVPYRGEISQQLIMHINVEKRCSIELISSYFEKAEGG